MRCCKRYIGRYMKWNKKYNFTKRQSRRSKKDFKNSSRIQRGVESFIR